MNSATQVDKQPSRAEPEQRSEAELQVRRRNEKRFDLVLEGGGVKGIGLVGALAALEERGFQSQRVAGSSAGAIVAALHAAGYTAEEMRDIVLAMDLEVFLDGGWLSRLPFIGPWLSVVVSHGIHRGERLHRWLREHLAAKGITTFADLGGGTDCRLQIIVSDVSERELLVLPRDAHKLGVSPEALEVAKVVRMSSAIPLFFRPVRLKNPRTKRHQTLVDGGLLSNFPVWLFDTRGEPRWPTFGLMLTEDEPDVPISSRIGRESDRFGLIGYLKSLVRTMLEAHDRRYLRSATFARTIAIPTLGVHTLEFELSKRKKELLYESGREAAEIFLATWDFHAYIKEFRSGRPYSRRVEVVNAMNKAA